MAITLGRNINSLVAERMLATNARAESRSLTRLSSGLRINQASDDAAGLAVSSSLSVNSRVYSQSIRNANDGISALSIADGTMGQLSDVLQRLKELATSAANGALGRTQRMSLDKEANSLVDEFNRLVVSTKFNGIKLTDGSLGELALQLGFGSTERIGASIGQKLSRAVMTDYSNTDSNLANSAGIITFGAPASGDLNGDGKVDMIGIDDAGQAYVSIGNGDGTFGSPTAVGGSFPLAVNLALADFNGDGKLDLVEAGNDGVGGGGLQVLLGNGNGTFGAATSLTATQQAGVRTADLNNDGKIDLISQDGTGNFSARLGNGNGTFQSATSISMTGNGGEFSVGDVNGDGYTDVVTGGVLSYKVALGNGNGTFQSGLTTTTSSSYFQIQLADFNNDGRLDIGALGGTTLYRMLGNGNGSFGAATSVGTASHFRLADMNGDGWIDFAAATPSNGYIKAFYGDGNADFSATRTFSATLESNSSYDIGVADLNGDGVMDFFNGFEVKLANTQQLTTLQHLNITTRQGALDAFSVINSAFDRLSLERGVIGSAQSRLAAGLGALFGRVDNYEAANSRIMNVDGASESADLLRHKIASQVAASVLAQANQTPQLILKLLAQ